MSIQLYQPIYVRPIRIEIIGETMESASVYLFPFIIEYSIIGSAVMYNMWKNIGKNPQYYMVGVTPNTKNNRSAR